jgi:hypothetical protein
VSVDDLDALAAQLDEKAAGVEAAIEQGRHYDEFARLYTLRGEEPPTREQFERMSAAPTVQLRSLFECLGRYLHLMTNDLVYFALAVAVSSRADGDPLWGLILGAPSSGKTEIIHLLDDVADAHPDEVTAASLISWSRGTKDKPSRPVGILTRIEQGLLTIADLSTILATSDRGGRDQLFALLRRVYDGEVTRDLGNAAHSLNWRGRLTLLGACTPAIDTYSAHTDALGPRWVYLRVDRQDWQGRRSTGRKSLDAGQLREHRTRAGQLCVQIVDRAASNIPSVLNDKMREAIIDAAVVACHGRSAVEREGYGRRDISAPAVIEEPPRLTAQLGLLARALIALGLDDDEVIRLCRRCAMDSMPSARLGVLRALVHDPGASVSEIARAADLHRQVARMTLEELDAIGVAECLIDPDDDPTGRWSAHPWQLRGLEKDTITTVITEDTAPRKTRAAVTRKVGSYPTHPPQNARARGYPTFRVTEGPDEEDPY